MNLLFTRYTNTPIYYNVSVYFSSFLYNISNNKNYIDHLFALAVVKICGSKEL